MTPRAWYESRIALWTRARAGAEAKGTTLSRLRLAAFFAAVALVVWAVRSHGPERFWSAMLAIAALIGFSTLVIRHARVLNAMERADAALQFNAHGLARLARDWNALPDVAPPATLDPDRHPYARDLDIFGRASLTRWLGRPATIQGAERLWTWLLDPSGVGTVIERQQAIEDLAPRAEWRESLAVEGMLTRVSADELARFVTWAEGTTAAVPRALYVLAFALPALTAASFGAMLLNFTDGAWFLIPLVIAITASFASARRIYEVFDSATVGQRSLERYATMLSLACGVSWTAAGLVRLKGQLCASGDAPGRVKALARLGGWSELRIGAALLHFPLQAITMWDFHVLFALERWRRRSGRHVRGWLAALGEIDALAVLARIRADQPEWAQPLVDRAAPAVSGRAVGHPLLPDARRVTNDVTIGPANTLLLITGSNMSGKSTLLRAIGLNAVLAQAGAPVCAAAFTMPPVNVQTSIRVQDSLELGLSYFMAALARLKQIVDVAHQPGPPLFYLLDEVLQGTNSIERGLAVRAIVRHLLEAGAIGVMTTHDLALADEEPIKSAAQLAHFTEQVHADGTMTFDYRLRPGLATSTNALRLMQLIGITPR